MPFIPANGFAGLAQQTAAVQALYRNGGTARRRPGGAGGRRARISRQVVKARRKSAKVARLVKGSAAAKRHMAKLRKMVKRRK